MLLGRSSNRLRHEVATLRTELLACQTIVAAQAEIIEAQRVNLNMARIVIKQAHSAAEDSQGEWLSVAKPYLPMEIFKLRQISEILNAALEGVEPEDQPIAE